VEGSYSFEVKEVLVGRSGPLPRKFLLGRDEISTSLLVREGGGGRENKMALGDDLRPAV